MYIYLATLTSFCCYVTWLRDVHINLFWRDSPEVGKEDLKSAS